MGNPCPRVDLVGGPTPFEHMARVGAALGHKGLWVKRDDCMPLAFGGNKVRSLEYWVGAALAEGADMLVVAGALPSNQCRLTAAAGAKLGIEVTFLYAGEEDAPLPGNAMLTELRGAEIRRRGPVDEAERARLAAAEITRLRAAGRCPYLIGDPFLGALGYVRAAEEIAAQDRERRAGLRHIILPGSMGGDRGGFDPRGGAGGFALAGPSHQRRVRGGDVARAAGRNRRGRRGVARPRFA